MASSVPLPPRFCVTCGALLAAEARFCGHCGTQQPAPPGICPVCGAPLAAAARFCGRCGAQQPAPSSLCPACGAPLVPGARFCAVCGAPVAGPVVVPLPFPPEGAPVARRRRGWLWALGGAAVLVWLCAVAFALTRLSPAKTPLAAATSPLRSTGTPAREQATAPGGATPDTVFQKTAPPTVASVSWQPLTAGKAQLPTYRTGSATGKATPQEGLKLDVGAAHLWIQPLALQSEAAVQAQLFPDGRLQVALDPPQDLAIPARVTLPLPPGATRGENPRTWPVAVLQTAGRPPLVLHPETVGSGDFTVVVPHFSDLVPAQWGDVLSQFGSQGLDWLRQLNPLAPSLVEATAMPPQGYSDGATVDSLALTIQARAITPRNGGLPEIKNGALAPEWGLFANLTAQVEILNPGSAGQPVSHTVPLQNGRGTLDLPLPEARRPTMSVVITLFTPTGLPLATTAFPVPASKLWTICSCKRVLPQKAASLDLRVYYISDSKLQGYPDARYARDHNAAQADLPAAVVDACEVADKSYRSYEGAAFFNDTANSPKLPILIYLQPWEESQAANYGPRDWFSYNYIKIRLSTAENTNWATLHYLVAHEMAHLFQQKYSTGTSGEGWWHDASAAYIAWKLWGVADDNVAGHLPNANPAWLKNGFFSGDETDNYGASSFLGYLVNVDKFNPFVIWKEGGSGMGNLYAWEGQVDEAVKKNRPTGLGGAWRDFCAAYLVDHGKWGQWTGVSTANSLWETVILKPNALAAEVKAGLPNFAASGVAAHYVGAGPEVLLVYRVRTKISEPLLFLGVGSEIDGRGVLITQGDRGQYLASATLNLTGAKGDQPAADARLVVAQMAKLGSWQTTEDVEVAVWVIPPVEQVKVEPPNLIWERSRFEDAADGSGQKLFGEYEVFGYRKEVSQSLTTLPAGTTSWALPPETTSGPQAMDRFCVRVRDAHGFTGPLGCPPVQLSGRYTGTLVVREVNADPTTFRDVDIDGDGTPDIAKKDCEAALQMIKGYSAPMAYEFTPKSANGGDLTLYSKSDDQWKRAEDSQGQPVVLSYKVEGDKVTFEGTAQDKGDSATVRFEGLITVSPQNTVSLKGKFNVDYTAKEGGKLNLKGDWDAKR